MTQYDEDELALGLADLGRFERGHAAFELNSAGALIYVGTDATVKLHDGEGMVAFIARLKRDHGFTQGDGLHFINNGRRIDTARILKRPAQRAA